MDRNEMTTVHHTHKYDLQLHAKKTDESITRCNDEPDVNPAPKMNFFGAGRLKDEFDF